MLVRVMSSRSHCVALCQQHVCPITTRLGLSYVGHPRHCH